MGRGGQKCFGVGVLHVLENALRFTRFNNSAVLHDNNLVSHIRDHGQIMGDHHQPHAKLIHQAFEQL